MGSDDNSIRTQSEMKESGIRIAYIASRESSYSRVAIIKQSLENTFDVTVFLSDAKKYPLRIVNVYLQFLIALLLGRLRNVNVLVVGFFAQPILPMLRFLWRGPIITDGYFSIFDTLVHDKARVSPQSTIGRICYWLDRYMLQNSDLVITDTLEHINYLKQEFNVPNAQIGRLWASAQDTILKPQQPLTWKDGETCKVLFWGGFIPLQGVEVIIRAAHLLRGKDVHFTIVGTGQTFRSCKKLSHELDVDNISFIGWQTLEELQDLAGQSHIILGIFGTTNKATRVIPNKAFQAIALAKPLITGDSPASRELFSNGNDAMLVPLGDPEALADRILWARDNYEKALTIANRGYLTFVEKASPARIQDLLSGYIQQVIRPAPTTATRRTT